MVGRGTRVVRAAAALALFAFTTVWLLLSSGGEDAAPTLAGERPNAAGGPPPALATAQPADAAAVPARLAPEGAVVASPAARPAEPPDDGAREVPVRVEFVDAFDGRVLSEPRLTLDGRGTADDPAPTARAGQQYAPNVGLGLPHDVVAWEPFEVNVLVARHATSAWMLHPLHRVVPVRVEIRGPDGRPARDARTGRFRIDGRTVLPPRDERDPGVVHSVPFLPGETLEVEVGWDLDGSGSQSLHELDEGGEPIDGAVALRMPEHPGEGLHAVATLPPRPAGILPGFVRVETDNDMPYEESIVEVPHESVPRGRLRVRVADAGERPAAGVRVVVGNAEATTDVAGVARFDDLPAGPYRVRLQEPGRVPVFATARVVAGETADVALVEPEGATAAVVVVDETGRPARYARLAVLQASGHWLDVHEGVQRLDPFTDVGGRRVLRHLEPGEVTVRASWGRRRGESRVVLRDGGDARVRVEVRPPEAPR